MEEVWAAIVCLLPHAGNIAFYAGFIASCLPKIMVEYYGLRHFLHPAHYKDGYYRISAKFFAGLIFHKFSKFSTLPEIVSMKIFDRFSHSDYKTLRHWNVTTHNFLHWNVTTYNFLHWNIASYIGM